MLPMRRIGHRGAMGHAPENTPASFEKAIALGCDEVETDVWIAEDGRLLIAHDRPTAATKLTLDEILDLCRGRVGVNVELKCDGDEARAGETGRRVAARLAERADPDAYVSSFWRRALRRPRSGAHSSSRTHPIAARSSRARGSSGCGPCIRTGHMSPASSWSRRTPPCCG